MTTPRYPPRRYTVEPDVFGKAETITWTDEPIGTEIQERAAQIQHAWAVAMNRVIKRRYGSLRAFAEEYDIPYQRLSRVLRGAEIMRLEDIAMAENLLGIEWRDLHLDDELAN